MIPLEQYIEEEFDGNKTAFGRALKQLSGKDFHPSNAPKLLVAARPYFVHDNKVFQISYEIKPENER